MLLGATYSPNKEAHQLAVCVHDVIRPSIFAHAGFSAKPELWVLQTILLTCVLRVRQRKNATETRELQQSFLVSLSPVGERNGL